MSKHDEALRDLLAVNALSDITPTRLQEWQAAARHALSGNSEQAASAGAKVPAAASKPGGTPKPNSSS